MWVVSFIYVEQIGILLLTMVLLLGNALASAFVFSKIGVTNIPSAFVASTYFLFMSSCPMIHLCWQGQLCIFAIFVIVLLMKSALNKKELIHETFLSTIIICFLYYVYPLALALIPLIWLILLFRRVITLRVLLASIIAVLLVGVYSLIFMYLGWIDPINVDVFSHHSNRTISISIAVLLFTQLITYLPIRKEHVATGICYGFFAILVVAYGVLIQMKHLLP